MARAAVVLVRDGRGGQQDADLPSEFGRERRRSFYIIFMSNQASSGMFSTKGPPCAAASARPARCW